MLTMQEMSDRLEIQDLLAAYCHAIDFRDWEALDDIFTPDAVIDYTEAGGQRGTLEETKAYLDRALQQFAGFQHLIGSTKLSISGDSADAKSILFNPMVTERDGQPHVFFVGLWYRDRLVRTPEGWRIKDRYEETPWFHNVPQDFQPTE